MGSNNDHNHKSHFILPTRTIVTVGIALGILTIITVGISRVDLGKANFLVAMLVATVKALFVAMVFMGLKYDKVENGVIFGTSFVFLAIFIALTATDWFFRGDVNRSMKDPFFIASKGGPAKFKKPWESNAEIIAHGKAVFAVQCASCHGAEGKGDGPAASAMNPKPRNFSIEEGWKNGRKPSQIFKTLKEGLAGTSMASFASLPAEDRWAMSHYVKSLGPSGPADTNADLAAVGVDPSKEGGGGSDEAKTIPVDFAMDRILN